MFKRPTDPPEYTHRMGIPAAAFLAPYGYAVVNGYSEIHQMGYLASGLCNIGSLEDFLPILLLPDWEIL